MSLSSGPIGILLSGHSSAGKTTLARALQDTFPEPWMIVEAERICVGYPLHRPEFVGIELDRQLREGCVRCALAFLDSGFSVVLEQGLWDPWATDMARRLLGTRHFFVVSVTCSPEVADSREAARLDRYGGTARQQRGVTEQTRLGADLTVDSTTRASGDLVSEIVRWLSTNPVPVALREAT